MVTESWPAREEWSSSAPEWCGRWVANSRPELRTRILNEELGRKGKIVNTLITLYIIRQAGDPSPRLDDHSGNTGYSFWTSCNFVVCISNSSTQTGYCTAQTIFVTPCKGCTCIYLDSHWPTDWIVQLLPAAWLGWEWGNSHLHLIWVYYKSGRAIIRTSREYSAILSNFFNEAIA